jgi:YcaO-like protein with predicted kinase domain
MSRSRIADWAAVDGPRKAHRSGTHRTVAPEDTVARARHLMPVMGITRIANITGLDYIGIPVVVATRPNSRSLAVSQGKGQTLAAARASALMESIEAYHAERITQPLKLASLEELWYTHRVVDVSRLPRSSERTFDRELPMLWIEGDELLGEQRMWVPYELVHTNYTDTGRIGAGRFQTSSNGLASGNDRQEALSHALCEVIERDASTLWDCMCDEAQEQRRIDLDTVDDAGCRELLRLYEQADVAVGVWDATSNIGIASFVCMIVDCADNPMRLLYPTAGMGCHPSRGVALSRALSEAAQSRLTVIAGSRDDVTRAEYERYRRPDALGEIRARLAFAGGRRSFESAPSVEHDTVGGDIRYTLAALRHSGIEQVVVVDLSRPEFGISVVRVVVPGLEGVSSLSTYVPGRRARAFA